MTDPDRDHDLLIALNERIKSLQHRVDELESVANSYATREHVNRIERIIWIIGTTVVVGITSAVLGLAGKFITWLAGG